MSSSSPQLRGETSGLELSPREWDVLQAVALFGGQKEAATALGISVQTVKNHVTSIYHKLSTDELQVTTQAEALVAVGWLVIPNRAGMIGRNVRHDVVAVARLREEIDALMTRATEFVEELAAIEPDEPA